MSRGQVDEEEEMHTAPHPTLGCLDTSLVGSKHIFQRYYEEGDSMAPWNCPKPTALPAWRSLCPSPTFHGAPFSIAPKRHRPTHTLSIIIKPTDPPTTTKSRRRTTVQQAKPPHLPVKGSHRGPIQLRSPTLRLLRHSDVSTAPSEQPSRKTSLPSRKCL